MLSHEITQSELRTRIFYIDFLRIISTFGIIILHVSALKWNTTPVTSFNWQIMNLYDSLVRWTVPVFIMISGMLHLQIGNYHDDFSKEKHIMYKKIFRVICAVIFWTIVYHAAFPVMSYVIGKNSSIDVHIFLSIPNKIIFQPGLYHLWYLYICIGLYLITPLLNRFINSSQRVHIKY